MKDLISIVIPVYKTPRHFLERCIESCLKQTYSNIEIMLIDDGSPDDCGNICDDYTKIDTRVKVIHQKNKGLSGARNTGVRESTGEWILFVDSDDYIDFFMCEKLKQSVVDEKCDVICCGYIRDSLKGKKVQRLNEINTGIYIGEQCKKLQENVLNFNSHFSTAYCKLIRKTFITKNNLYHNEELRQGAEGIEFNIRLFENVQKVVIINEYLYYYVFNEDSISQSHNEKNHEFVIRCFEKIKDEIEKSNNCKMLIEKFYNRIGYVIVTTAITGYFNKNNKEAYKVKKEKFGKYLENKLIKESLNKIDLKKFDIKRKIILLLIQKRMFFLINIMSKFNKKKI